MRLHKGDTVQIILGKDRGKRAKVLKVIPQSDKIVVDGLNVYIKHARPRREREKGQRIHVNVPVKCSNVMLVCPKCNKPTRIGCKVLTNQKKIRICKKCQEAI